MVMVGCCVKKRKIPTELVAELVAALRFDVRWATVRVSAAFDHFLLKSQSAWLKATKDLDGARRRLTQFVSEQCSDFGRAKIFTAICDILAVQVDGREEMSLGAFKERVTSVLRVEGEQRGQPWINKAYCKLSNLLDSFVTIRKNSGGGAGTSKETKKRKHNTEPAEEEKRKKKPTGGEGGNEHGEGGGEKEKP